MNKLQFRHKRKTNIRWHLLFNCVLSFIISLVVIYLFSFLTSYILNKMLQTSAHVLIIGVTWAFTLFVVFSCSFTVTFFLLTRRMVNDLITLEKGLDIIAQGNMDYRVSIIREDELGRVAANINRMAERLQQKIIQERESESAKMEMITGISHDLRTPLTSIIGYMELLRSHSFHNEEEQLRFVENAYNKSLHLKKMLDDLFEYTRLSWNDVRLQLEPIDLAELVNQLYFEYEPIAREHGITVITKLVDEPVIVMMDSEKMARAIDNLLINALKYSLTPSTVHITMKRTDTQIYIEITNEGIPLTKEQERRLFERFYKADYSRNHNGIQTGAGLGLSIAKNIVELHGGTLSFSHLGKLFTFTIYLPLTTDRTRL
ncbi:sensor histidine kinase [Paenibacillus dauci]|uniref:sensor histidine kinase n=1 Tax=Paenibacillus dauci TaxID=1567106 RepID=UPI0006197986|nr:HAMP domain-containing sensor histidine kinase [Paenibacillus dauci]